MATADQIARYIAGLRGGTITKTNIPALRAAKIHAETIVEAVLSSDLAELDRLLTGTPADLATIALTVHLAIVRGGVEHQRRAAQAKNREARVYVLSQWKKRPVETESKANFSRRYVAIVRKKFGTTLKAETIARSWLCGDDEPSYASTAVAWTGRYIASKR